MTEFASAVRRLGFAPQTDGIWIKVGQTKRDIGWKLHLSSMQGQAQKLLDRVAHVLQSHGTPFKLARDAMVLGLLNEGAFGEAQVGKFATIYPHSDQEATEVARLLVEATFDCLGPSIRTDMYLGGAVYARYGDFVREVVRDRLGYLREPEESGLGKYRIPFEVPPGIPCPFERGSLGRNTKSVGAMASRYLPTAVIKKDAKGDVLRAISLTCPNAVRTVVIKRGRRYCLSDSYGRHIWDRLRHQFDRLTALRETGVCPHAIELFEDGDMLNLVIEDVVGKTLAETWSSPLGMMLVGARIDRVCQLIAVARAVAKLHAAGIFHRDLSPRNVLINADGAVTLIDLEMSYSLADDGEPFQEGTRGYVSPEQRAGSEPKPSDDIYAFGCLMVLALTARDPFRVVAGSTEEVSERLETLSGAGAPLCRLAADCLAADQSLRPDLEMVIETLENCRSDEAVAPIAMVANRSECLSLAALGCAWVLEAAPRDSLSRLWSSPVIEDSHENRDSIFEEYRLYRSANRGVAGVLYTLCRLWRWGVSERPSLIQQANCAVDWLLEHQDTRDDQMPGLHFGEAGVAVAIAEAIGSGVIARGDWLEPYLVEALDVAPDWPDLTHGAAGQGIACLLVGDILGDPRFAAMSQRFADYLLAEQSPDGAWRLPRGVKGLEGMAYTGLAHGTAGCIHFLAELARRENSDQLTTAAERGVEWLLSKAERSGRSLIWPLSPADPARWNWWCHGGCGIAVALLSMYRLTSDSDHRTFALDALALPAQVMQSANLSQCHGLSGLGEVLLSAHAVLRDDALQNRAEMVAATLTALARKERGLASWLVESPFRTSADLMVGQCGVIHFLARFASSERTSTTMPLGLI